MRLARTLIPRADKRRGATPVEVAIVVLILGLVFLLAIFMIPRQRELARLNGCRRNLMQIGVAVVLYDKFEGHLPTVAEPTSRPALNGPGPLAALLETLGLTDLSGLTAGNAPTKGVAPRPVAVVRLPDFLCETDPYSRNREVLAPVSYRATTGDLTEGVNGGFAPGRRLSLAEIEPGDGQGFTAAFAERLIGNGKANDPAPANYGLVPGPIDKGPWPTPDDLTDCRGDAGSDWGVSGWRSTLYNHTLAPNGAPSFIASDGRSAIMGASSGHPSGVNVLMFDGGVRTVTPGIDLAVWKSHATTDSQAEGPTNPHLIPNPAPKEPR